MSNNDIETMPSKSDNDAMNQALSGFLEVVGCPEGVNSQATSILVEQVQHLKVLAGNSSEGKKEARRALCQTFGLKGNTSYADVISHLDDDTNGVLRVENPIPWDEWTWMHTILDGDEEQPEVVEDEQPEVVEDETPSVSIASMITSLEKSMARQMKSLRDSVNARFDTIESNIDEMDSSIIAMESKMDSRPTKAPSLMDAITAKPQPKVESQPEVDDDDEPTISDGDFKPLKSYTPKGWKDSVNYTVAVICDSVTPKKGGNHPVRLAFGMTKDEATTKGRKIALRSILNVLDENIQSEDWFADAAAIGVTDEVIDSFLTNPVVNRQTAIRSGVTRLNKLGVTDLASYNDAVNSVMEDGGNTTTSTPKTSTKSTKVDESVSVDMTEAKKVMKTFNVGLDEAIAFLTE